MLLLVYYRLISPSAKREEGEENKVPDAAS